MAFVRKSLLFTTKEKAKIEAIFKWLYFSLVIIILVGFASVHLDQPFLFKYLMPLGGKLAQASVFFYCLSLLPGILTRFAVLPTTTALLKQWRRQSGVLMFWLAIAHSFLSRTFPVIAIDPNLLSQPPLPVVFGMLALFILFPLWLTSNDYSLSKMGNKNWKLLHRITYLALLLIMIHAALSVSGAAILLFVVLLGEATSWLVSWRLAAHAKSPNE